MKKLVSLVLTLCLALSCTAFVLADEAAYQPGTYEAYGDGFMDAVKLTLTLDEKGITAIEAAHEETPTIGGVIIDAVKEQLIGLDEEAAIAKVDDLGPDVMSSATFAHVTRDAVKDALTKAFAKAKVEEKAEAAALIPGTYEGSGTGYSPTTPVTVKVTVDEQGITAVEIEGKDELPFGVPQFETYANALVGRADADIDAVAGATMTRDGIKEAVEKALAAARGENTDNDAEMSFTPGEYTGTYQGYNGPVTVKATFSETKLEAIEVVSSAETAHVGDVAFDVMIPEML